MTSLITVKSGRGPQPDATALMAELGVTAQPFPGFVQPMLATLTEERFSRDGWIFEQKFDGERCLVTSHQGRVTLWTRNQKQINHAYPEIVEAMREQPRGDFIVDGEIVALGARGSAFNRLQPRMHRLTYNPSLGIIVALYLFDILWLDGFDLTDLALMHRKAVLKEAINFGKVARFTPWRSKFGERFYAKACRDRWEGLIAKRADSPYQHFRSRDWLKFKCVNEQEFVIVGFTDPKGERESLGALLLGYYEAGRLIYAGKVGTGFDNNLLRTLYRKLNQLQTKTPPVTAEPRGLRGTHWVKPALVCEVRFTEWTDSGQLRHPVFLGLRDDKKPRAVFREMPS